jgi:4a-hydroxytetrahydrobiopterin dehydratase
MSVEPPEKAWTEAANALHKVFEFESFGQALAFMSSAAPLIEAMNHHPEWTNVYNRVMVRLTTHDAGHTVTPKDWELAKVLDSHYEAFEGNQPRVN